MKYFLLILLCFVVVSCTKKSEEITFAVDHCSKYSTGRTTVEKVQTGCWVYAVDEKGMPNGMCLFPSYSDIEYKEVVYECKKSEWEQK